MVYRQYQLGDDFSLIRKDFGGYKNCDFFLCWTVLGAVKIDIPEKSIGSAVRAAIEAHRPKGSPKIPGGIFGSIIKASLTVEVAEAWVREDISMNLLVDIFNHITTNYVYWDVIHISVDRADKGAIELYETLGFIK
ncbi:hypothetical protein Pmar_PMAR005589, partial [Perkinsus marinus ATCC 50983]